MKNTYEIFRLPINTKRYKFILVTVKQQSKYQFWCQEHFPSAESIHCLEDSLFFFFSSPVSSSAYPAGAPPILSSVVPMRRQSPSIPTCECCKNKISTQFFQGLTDTNIYSNNVRLQDVFNYQSQSIDFTLFDSLKKIPYGEKLKQWPSSADSLPLTQIDPNNNNKLVIHASTPPANGADQQMLRGQIEKSREFRGIHQDDILFCITSDGKTHWIHTECLLSPTEAPSAADTRYTKIIRIYLQLPEVTATVNPPPLPLLHTPPVYASVTYLTSPLLRAPTEPVFAALPEVIIRKARAIAEQELALRKDITPCPYCQKPINTTFFEGDLHDKTVYASVRDLMQVFDDTLIANPICFGALPYINPKNWKPKDESPLRDDIEAGKNIVVYSFTLLDPEPSTVISNYENLLAQLPKLDGIGKPYIERSPNALTVYHNDILIARLRHSATSQTEWMHTWCFMMQVLLRAYKGQQPVYTKVARIFSAKANEAYL